MNKTTFVLLSGVLAGAMAMDSAWATTTLVEGETIFNLNGGTAVDMGTGVKGKSWYDPTPPASGMGWTHNSKWGYFTAISGKTYTITVRSSNPNLHPGLSVWYRTNLKDKAGTNTGSIYVPDHFYSQRNDWIESSPKDPTDNDAVTPYGMWAQTWDYDRDGTNNTSVTALHPIMDSTAGKLRVTFTASNTGTYMLVVGGINPGQVFPDPGYVPLTVQVQQVIPALPLPAQAR